jgi:proline dehydrogenase
MTSAWLPSGPAARVRAALRRTTATGWAPIRQRTSSEYRAGPRLDHALETGRRLADHGLAATVGYSAPIDESPRDAANVHLGAFDRLASASWDCYVSVKLSALHFDPALFAALELAATRTGRRLHLDALAPELAEPTWALLEDADNKPALGTTLPGRWRRSADDAARAVELGVAVRVVKGQWPDPDAHVDEARGFLSVVDRLAGATTRVAIATHDVPLLEEALRRLLEAGTTCELELFYGLPFTAPARAAQRLGAPIRVYVPYGHAGAPYRAVDIARRPRVASWFVQDLVAGDEKMWRSIRRA